MRGLVLFNLILYVPSTIFQLNRDGSSWVEPVLSWDKCVLLKDHNAVTPMRLEPAAPRPRVKHSTTEPLRSLGESKCLMLCLYSWTHQGLTIRFLLLWYSVVYILLSPYLCFISVLYLDLYLLGNDTSIS